MSYVLQIFSGPVRLAVLLTYQSTKLIVTCFLIFEVKTSLSAPHGQRISFMRHAKIVRNTLKSFAES
jgi:hypothetical protein